jgi:hypothetical protein
VESSELKIGFRHSASAVPGFWHAGFRVGQNNFCVPEAESRTPLLLPQILPLLAQPIVAP